MLAALAATVVDDLIPALGGYQTNKGVSGLIPLGEIPGNGPLVLRSVLALFGADFEDAARGRQHAVDLAFAAVHLAGLALVVAAVVVAAWGLARTLARLARAGGGPDGSNGQGGSGGPGGAFTAGDLVADVTVVAVVICVVTYVTLFKLSNIYSAHEIGPVLSLGAALAGRRLGGPLARACGLRTGTAAGLRKPRVGGPQARVAVLPALTALLACYCAMLGFAAAQRQTPPANAALAVWLQQHGLRSGLAGYWEASVVTVETEGAITVGSVTPLPNGGLAPRHWEQDMRIFDPATRRATFVVLAPDSPMSESDVLRTFGPGRPRLPVRDLHDPGVGQEPAARPRPRDQLTPGVANRPILRVLLGAKRRRKRLQRARCH